VEYKGHTIADVLDMTVEEALEVFCSFPKIARRLNVLSDVGLGYLPLGQSAPSLSGGEAQRVKLASELGTRSRGHTLYLLDEPTTGLHTADITRLLRVIHSLVDRGNTVVIIEHNLDLIKTADYVIDLGPGGGTHGGTLVASGRPEEVAASEESATAPYLCETLDKSDSALPEDLYALSELEAADDGEAERIAYQATPWEEDGRTWHFEMITTSEGNRPDWPTETLDALISHIENLPEQVRTDYEHRDHVEFRADGEAREWIKVKTDHEFALELVMYTPKGLFDEGDLAARLNLPVWNDLPDLPHYGKTARVRVYTNARDYDRVRILLHYPEEVNADAFREMLQTGWSAHLKRVEIE
ncbi:MAG: excinuclease ABC subunit A, partial [Armatimonadota bacterium]